MQRSKSGAAVGAYRLDSRLLPTRPEPALYARMWAGLLAALHESRKDEAARVIRRHRELIDNFQTIELSSPNDGVKADE